jgi:CheY-like chemotaxis protein
MVGHDRLGDPQPGVDRPLVLVVEDDLANRTLLERILEREGYRTTAAGDGEAALLAVGEHSPDLVLLDIGLPRMDGYEVTRRLRAHIRTLTVPIILLTGRSGLEDVVEGLDAGADDSERRFASRSSWPDPQRPGCARRCSMDAAHTAVAALANAVEAKDPTTERHCQRLANLAARLGTPGRARRRRA